MTENSEQIFRLLETGTVGSDLRSRMTDAELPGGRVAQAVDRAGGRHILIPLAPGQSAFEDRRSRGVIVTERILLDGEQEIRYLDLSCRLGELREVFAVFCDDLVRRLIPAGVDTVTETRAVLERWRELLRADPGPVLGVERLAGILAELHFMEHVAAVDPAAAAILWTGPDKAMVDFTGTRARVEVKATTTRDRIPVQIHGLGQLDDTGVEDVYLYAEHLESVPVGGDSVPDVVDRLTSAGVDPHRILNGLAVLGYRPADAPAYRLTRFVTLTTRTVRTGAPGFPRLIPSALADPGLANRISHVRYTIDLTDPAQPGHLGGPERAVSHLLEARP